jgi:hypothetical protein
MKTDDLTERAPMLARGFYYVPCETRGCSAFYASTDRDPAPWRCPACQGDDLHAAIMTMEERDRRARHTSTRPLLNTTPKDTPTW